MQGIGTLPGKEPGAKPDVIRRALTCLLWIVPILFAVLFPIALIQGGIWTDEAWIGQQVHSLLSRGVIYSDLFRDVPPLDGQILVYHKLLVWAGAGISQIAGWGIYELRCISVVAGLVTLAILLFWLPDVSRRARRYAVLLLLFTPLFWQQMMMFRPESMMVMWGVVSYVVLRQLGERRVLWALVAGVCAGLAGLTHAVGLIFAAAGVVALGVERDWRKMWLFAVGAALAFSPFFSGAFQDPNLFWKQLFHNETMATSLSFHWWQPLANFIEDHKRIFRTPAVIGISVLFVLSLLLTTRQQWRNRRFFWTYLAVLFSLTAVAPLPKMSRYVIPLTPFFALASAEQWEMLSLRGSGYRKAISAAFGLWLVVFFVYGIAALGVTALNDRDHQVRTNAELAARMNSGTVAMAPYDFVYPGARKFTVQSWFGCRRACGGRLVADQADNYAYSRNIDYLILSDDLLAEMGMGAVDMKAAFRHYQQLLLIPEGGRYLLGRVPTARN
ncbi:MAG TPA: glycosyltransferase family 39 protein [Candidatus Acidoferrum sp.]|nr:glycosyltransferase family 39 protein [Candidatus Acidoferrum sp.]